MHSPQDDTKPAGIKRLPVSVYLAGPMLDFTGDYHAERAKNWREDISDNLPENVLLFSPAHAFFGCNKITAPMLDYIERCAISGCNGVLVNLMEEDRAFGSIRDIEFAVSRGIPVAVAGNIESLMAHDVIVKSTVNEAFESLLFKIADIRNMPPSMFGFPLLTLTRDDLAQPDDEQ